MAQAEAIIDAGVQSFMHWLDQRGTVPLIQAAATRRPTTGARPRLARARKLLAKGEDVDAVLEALSRGLTQKMLHGAHGRAARRRRRRARAAGADRSRACSCAQSVSAARRAPAALAAARRAAGAIAALRRLARVSPVADETLSAPTTRTPRAPPGRTRLHASPTRTSRPT